MPSKIIKLTILLFALFFAGNVIHAAKSPDAIAIRVIPNTEHYSPTRWYKEQGFSGSPQIMSVDGYEAIRDGRTVYVNAANIGADNTIYTNIYLMSYNQDAEKATVEIVNEILSHWRFNANITDSGQCVDQEGNLGNGCLTDADCLSAQGGSASGGQYCQSPKAKITRDTRRLSDLAEIKIALADYKQENNKYPLLAFGSYLPGKSLSTWPSWKETLEKELWASLPNDPINKMGQCDGYNQTTCWNEQTKKFADTDLVDLELNLPACSRAYVYAAKDNGASYNVCAVMESGFLTTLDVGACAESEMTAQFSQTSENNPPQITGVNLPQAESGPSYLGFVSAIDPDGDLLNWTLAIIDCPLWNNLRLESTGLANQKKIIADNAGQAGICQITITIDDKREAGQISQNYSITTVNGNLPIIQPIANQTITIGKDLSFTITASEADLQYPLTIEFTGAPAGLNSTGSGQIIGTNYQFNISGIIIDQTKAYNITAIAYDKYLGASVPVNFTVTVENQPPTITSTPVITATACVDYSYDVNATDLDGHTIEYFDPANTLPANLTLNQATGLISGQPQTPGNYNIAIEARDQYYGQTIAPYSAKYEQTYTLNVSNEIFTVTAPADDTIYVAPATVPIAGLYYFPITFFGTPTKSTANTVTWSRTVSPALPAGLTIVINPTTGDINATATDNATNPGGYTVTVTATNNCGAQASDSFILTIKPNEWCGDNVLQTAQGESCDTTQLNGQTCVSLGFSAGTLGCLNSCTFDTTGCCNSACAARECGADPASCLASCPPGCGLNASCDGSGQCQCDLNYADCDGSATDADGCEVDLLANNNNCGVCGTVCPGSFVCLNGLCKDIGSCKAILNNNPASPTGIYTIDPDGSGAISPFDVYCDMTTDGGGWTLIMKLVNAKFGYYDALWTDNSVLNANDFDFTTNGKKSKYQTFNTVAFKEIKTSDTNNFNNYFKYNLGSTYTSAKALFSGGGIQISSGSLNTYFNDRAPAAGKHWSVCGAFEATVLNTGINQKSYLTDYGAFGGAGGNCDWGGGARFGQRVNGFCAASGNMIGQGWGPRNQLDEVQGLDNWNFNISQLLWVR